MLPAPNLDDRHFQDLVDDAKRLVQKHCPAWTDHNVSDPGVTLIEAFAQMVDQLIYRLNRVPDRNYVSFLELVGVRLFPPTAARGTVTFWLSAPQPAPVLVRSGVEVATPRTDIEDAVVFTTMRDLNIQPCELLRIATAPAVGDTIDRTQELSDGRQISCFAERPAVGDALLIGLDAAVPGCAVTLRFDCPVGGVGIDPEQPPLIWEAWTGSGWTACDVHTDATKGFNRPGDVVLHIPAGHEMSLVARQRAGWVRCRIVDPPNVPRYTASPKIASLRVFTIGGTVDIVHAEAVRDEDLGRSDGTPAQRFPLARGPVVPTEEPPVLLVADHPDAGWTPWTAVSDFAHSGPTDRHFRIDPVAGEVEFGPAVRQQDGTLRQFGDTPVQGALLRLTAYRIGGGNAGNVTPGVVRVLKTSVPYVARVENRHAATGGTEPETVEAAKVRGPLTLRSTGRAVTAEDYEELAREVAPDAARLRCVAASARSDGAEAGGVRLLVVPRTAVDAVGRPTQHDLQHPPEELLRRISDHLDSRRVIGTRLAISPPRYLGVTVVARVSAATGQAADQVREAALSALYRYLSPLDGGADGKGWPFGRPVQAFDLSAVLSRVPGVGMIDEVLLFPADLATGRRATAPVTRLELGSDDLVLSYQHQVRVG